MRVRTCRYLASQPWPFPGLADARLPRRCGRREPVGRRRTRGRALVRRRQRSARLARTGRRRRRWHRAVAADVDLALADRDWLAGTNALRRRTAARPRRWYYNRLMPVVTRRWPLTLIAVVLALVLGHVAPAWPRLRRYGWFISWLQWLGRASRPDSAPGRAASAGCWRWPAGAAGAAAAVGARRRLLRPAACSCSRCAAVLHLGPARPGP